MMNILAIFVGLCLIVVGILSIYSLMLQPFISIGYAIADIILIGLCIIFIIIGIMVFAAGVVS